MTRTISQTRETHPALWYIREECWRLVSEGQRLLDIYESSGKDVRHKRQFRDVGQATKDKGLVFLDLVQAQDEVESRSKIYDLSMSEQAMDAALEESPNDQTSP